MKLNLKDMTPENKPFFLRDAKAMRSLTVTVNGEDMGDDCTYSIDSEGHMVLAFTQDDPDMMPKKPKRGRFKRFDDVD